MTRNNKFNEWSTNRYKSSFFYQTSLRKVAKITTNYELGRLFLGRLFKGVVRSEISRRFVEVDQPGRDMLFTLTESDKN